MSTPLEHPPFSRFAFPQRSALVPRAFRHPEPSNILNMMIRFIESFRAGGRFLGPLTPPRYHRIVSSMCLVRPGLVVFPRGNAHFPAWDLPGGARTATTTPEWPDLALETSKTGKMKPDLPRIHSGMVPRVSRHRRFLHVFLVKTHISLAGGSAQVPEQ